jgi:hypothetical protein
VINVISTIYKIYWDIVVDWGLFDINYRFLRKKLVFNEIYYYIAMIANVFLRVFWIIVFILKFYLPNQYMDNQLVLFLIAFLEIIRRFIWDILRVENEFLNNCENFRVTNEIPLFLKNNQNEIFQEKVLPENIIKLKKERKFLKDLYNTKYNNIDDLENVFYKN